MPNSNINHIKAVILAGSRDFGRCPLASRLLPCLWPLAGTSVLQHLIEFLSAAGITDAVICSNSDTPIIRNCINQPGSMDLKFMNESLPAGTAGCIRDATQDNEEKLLLILDAATVSPPNIDILLASHLAADADITVAFQPVKPQCQSPSSVSDIYLCAPEVLKFIAPQGYCDIKEGLIPAMLRAGSTVNLAKLDQPVGNFHNRIAYLRAVADYLHRPDELSCDLPQCPKQDSANIWLAPTASVNSTARIVEPVVIMENVVVQENVIILGPAIVEPDVTIAPDTLVQSTVIWAGSHIGRNCQIYGSVIDYDLEVPDCTIIAAKTVISCLVINSKIPPSIKKHAIRFDLDIRHLANNLKARLPAPADFNYSLPAILKTLAITLLVFFFIWSYWPHLTDLWGIWQRSDEYSAGLLVPPLALYLLWTRRDRIAKISIRPSIWGLALFVVAQAARHFGLFFMYASAQRLSLILSIAALILLLFGWKLLKNLSPLILFLALMLPFPKSLHTALMLPLQSIATISAVFCLETIGYTVIRQGNIIDLNGTTVAVAEACNGLRMVTAFLIIIALVVLMVQRSLWQKIFLLFSSLPIALFCNTLRLTITAIAFTILAAEKWEQAFHDFGGYAMMPLAVMIVILELWLLTKLTAAPDQPVTQSIIIRKSK